MKKLVLLPAFLVVLFFTALDAGKKHPLTRCCVLPIDFAEGVHADLHGEVGLLSKLIVGIEVGKQAV